MDKIKFKRKAKGFATLGSLASVSSLVLAACADNSSSNQVDQTTLSKVTELVSSNSDTFKSLLNDESVVFGVYVDILNFDKDLDQTIITNAKKQLGTSNNEALNYTNSQTSEKDKNDAIKAASAIQVLKKLQSDLKKSKTVSENKSPATDAQISEFDTLFTQFTTAVNNLSSEFAKLPQTKSSDLSKNELNKLATALKSANSSFASSENNESFDTAMQAFIAGVEAENTKLAPLLTSALALTKATSAINKFANRTDLKAFVSENSDFALEVQGLVTKVSDDILGMPGEDLFAPADAPTLLTTEKTSSQVYSIFAKLFTIDETISLMKESSQLMKFYKGLSTQNQGAIEVLAKNYKDISLNVDFARLNAYVSFNNTNVWDVFETGQKTGNNGAELDQTKLLSTISTKLKSIEDTLSFVVDDGSDGLNQKIQTLKADSDDSNASKFTDLTSSINNKKSDIQKAIEVLKKVNEAFAILKQSAFNLNNIILANNGFEGMIQMLGTVETMKKAIKTINDAFEVPEDTNNKSEVKKTLEDIKNNFDGAQQEGIAKKLVDLIKAGTTKVNDIKVIVGNLNDNQDDFKDGKIHDLKNDISNAISSYDDLLNSSKDLATTDVPSLSWIKRLLFTTYKPSVYSQTFKLFVKLSNQY